MLTRQHNQGTAKPQQQELTEHSPLMAKWEDQAHFQMRTHAAPLPNPHILSFFIDTYIHLLKRKSTYLFVHFNVQAIGHLIVLQIKKMPLAGNTGTWLLFTPPPHSPRLWLNHSLGPKKL